MTLANQGRQSTHGSLNESDVDPDPFRQFDAWLAETVAAGLPEPSAMTLATATPDGKPAARTVLLRGLDTGFVFYTNYDSRKGDELAANPFAALLFFWPELQRQVRIEGRVELVTAQESDAYFRGRPRGSRLGAWASRQSSVLPNRETLEQRMRELEVQYPGEDVPRPPYWGGYRVLPESIEFWQGRDSRLHDRLLYSHVGGQWRITRLAP